MFRRLLSRFRARLSTRRGIFQFACVLLALGLLVPQVWAWYHLRAARTALAQHHPQQARAAVAACLRVWSERPSVRLVACRAAWQDGDSEAAMRELRAAQRLTDGTTDEIAFEWALVQATGGNVREVDEYLQRRIEQSPAVGPLVWEALTIGYLRIYRTLDAMACLNHWLSREPENVRALELRGQTFITGRGVVRGAEDLRRVVQLDPSRRGARRMLAEALLTLGAYDEATGHLEVLLREAPNEPNFVAMLARCYNFGSRRDDARRLLDDALARHPDHGLCLRTRGQIALMEGQKVEAEQWLRRAAVALPEDYQTQWLLFDALRQQGKFEEAKEQNRRADAVKERAERIAELQSRKLAEFPLDPALHYELGMLLIRTGHGEVGVQWLQSALNLAPDYQPARSSLIAYYESRGERAKAESYRSSP